MKIYQLKKGRACAEIHLAGSLLDWTEQVDKIASLKLGEETPNDITFLDVRVHFKEKKPYKLPDISVDRFLTYFSERAIASFEKERLSNIQFIPVNIICAGAHNNSGDWCEVPLSDYPFDISQKYFAVHPKSIAEVLDRKNTLMSTEYFHTSTGIPPGNYLELVFKSDTTLPLLFVLPGRSFGMLASEEFINIAKRKKLSGVGKDLIFETDTHNTLPSLNNTNSKFISSMEDLWRRYDSA